MNDLQASINNACAEAQAAYDAAYVAAWDRLRQEAKERNDPPWFRGDPAMPAMENYARAQAEEAYDRAMGR